MPKKRKLFIWQRRLFIALLVAACSCVIGLNLSEPHLVQQTTLLKEPMKRVAALTLPERVSTFAVPKEFEGKVIAETRLPIKEKVIALTFDDGPWPRTTEQVLDILKQNDIKATFFWIGKNVKNYPDIAKRVVEDSHVIGNHTWHHWYRHMDVATATCEIDDTAAIIYKTTGVKTSLFRPPGGILNNGPAGYAEKHDYAVMMWSADSRDWFYRRASPSILVNNVLKEALPGGIVLMHDGGGDRSKTVQALPEIISGLRQRGYKFVTVPELLALKDKELKLTSPSDTIVDPGKKPQVKQPQQLAN